MLTAAMTHHTASIHSSNLKALFDFLFHHQGRIYDFFRAKSTEITAKLYASAAIFVKILSLRIQNKQMIPVLTRTSTSVQSLRMDSDENVTCWTSMSKLCRQRRMAHVCVFSLLPIRTGSILLHL